MQYRVLVQMIGIFSRLKKQLEVLKQFVEPSSVPPDSTAAQLPGRDMTAGCQVVKRHFLDCLLAVIVFFALPNFASTSPTKEEEYNKCINNAKACYYEDDYECCVSNFRCANDLSPHPIFLYSIAICLSNGNQYSEAIEYYKEYLSYIEDPIEITKVQKALEECADRLGKITIKVDPPSAKVYVDEMLLEKFQIDAPMILDPGPHRIKAEDDHYYTEERSITLVPGKTVSVEIKLRKQEYSVALACEEENVVLFIKDKKLGPCPYSGKFEFGKYRVVGKDQNGNTKFVEDISIVDNTPFFFRRISPPIKPPPLPPSKNWPRIFAYVAIGLGATTLSTIAVVDTVATRKAIEAKDHRDNALELSRNSPEYEEEYELYEQGKADYEDWIASPGRITAFAVGGALMLGGGVLFFYNLAEQNDAKIEHAVIAPTPGGILVNF